jgi:hypothetical protein
MRLPSGSGPGADAPGPSASDGGCLRGTGIGAAAPVARRRTSIATVMTAAATAKVAATVKAPRSHRRGCGGGLATGAGGRNRNEGEDVGGDVLADT